jgi:hypothetical protein
MTLMYDQFVKEDFGLKPGALGGQLISNAEPVV